MTTVTYEQLKKANEGLKLTPIKGKDYAEVNQRIKGFRMVYPMGFINTDMQLEGDLCVFKAEVGYYGDNGERLVIGTGTAFEERQSSYINKTSYIENCETSAVGRALGMAGFGIDTAVCSAEELNNALEAQKANEAKVKDDPKATALKIKIIREKVPQNRIQDFLTKFKLASLEDADMLQLNIAINTFAKEGYIEK